ncbi:MAG: hypothetical protein ABIC82_00705 [bacterium]
MAILVRIFFGGLGFALGFYLVAKTEWWLNTFGRIQWAEQHLGTSGGTRLMYKLIGLLIIFFAFIYITGFGQSFALWALSPLMKHMK